MVLAVAIMCLYIFCGVVCYAVIGHVMPEEIEDDEILAMGVCVIMWPLFAVIGLCKLCLWQLVKLGSFITGFLDEVHKQEED